MCRILFWSPATDSLKFYWLQNISLWSIKEYLLIGDNSMNKQEWIDKNPQLTYVSLDVNDMLIKADYAFNLALSQKKDWDFLVKIDLDALLLDYGKLVQMLTECLNQKAFIGVFKKRKECEPGESSIYIRGGCQAFSRSLIERMVANPCSHIGIKAQHLDTYMIKWFDSLTDPDKILVSKELFTITSPRKEVLSPVWHPKKKAKREAFVLGVDNFLMKGILK